MKIYRIIGKRGRITIPYALRQKLDIAQNDVAESDNKQNRMLFKLAVEMSMMMNLMAATQDIDKIALERLRGECVKEVARLNGAFSFEDALDWQKG